jgi:nucleotide-binding universal stress UspA family protein
MYKRILLASDGATESLVALREGALIARALNAAAFLLIVEADSPGVQMASGVHPVARDSTPLRELLALGLARLERLGVVAQGDVRAGEPAAVISEAARAFGADLIVVGHRRKTLLERWWSGETGGYIVDRVPCSVLIARDLISDAEFESHLSAAAKKG